MTEAFQAYTDEVPAGRFPQDNVHTTDHAGGAPSRRRCEPTFRAVQTLNAVLGEFRASSCLSLNMKHILVKALSRNSAHNPTWSVNRLAGLNRIGGIRMQMQVIVSIHWRAGRGNAVKKEIVESWRPGSPARAGVPVPRVHLFLRHPRLQHGIEGKYMG
jgi:hypothetical protein